VTRHSIVRSVDPRADSDRNTKGTKDVTMAPKRKYCDENSERVIEEVVLGVDTHLDAHVAVALDGLGIGAWES
jgi:hypothetical protein